MKVKEHIAELKKGVYKSAIVLGLIFVGVLMASPFLLTKLVSYYGINVVALNPLESINAQLFMTTLISIICIVPMLTFGIIKFIKPAYNTRKFTSWLVMAEFLAIFGFMVGATYFTKVMLSFLSSASLFSNLWSINNVLSLGMVIGFIFAGSSEFMLLIPLAKKFGLNTDKLGRYRAGIIVALLLVAGILTPTSDMFSQLITAIPMYACFEIGMIASKFTGGKNVRNK